ncbi:MAG: hypothetical protein IT262_18005 [Saprospiraceae bacterium]|nr:hypothetical protein [Saprospiraceae bacterium]
MRSSTFITGIFTLITTGFLSAQNVGIGTMTPLEKLHVEGNTYTTGITRTEAFSMGGGNTFTVNTPTVAGGRFFISPEGRVGIGTNNPASRFQVLGHSRFEDFTITGNSNFEVNDGLVAGGRFRIMPDGSVGIGVQFPSAKLEVAGNLEISGGGEVFMENTNIRKLNTLEGFNGLYLRPNPGNSNLVNIDPNGNVGIGIGTNAPAQKLQVNGTTRTVGLQVTDGAVSGHILRSDASGTASWVNPASLFPGVSWTVNGANQFSALSGSVGIGTSSPGAKLDVAGNILVSGGGAVILENSHVKGLNTLEGSVSGIYMRPSQGGNITVNIDPNENVGIGMGTSSPGSKLQVNGNFSVSNGAKNFITDHPLDPANKSLLHACIESPEVLNVYSGTTILDANGKATIQLPDYFEALNKDFRYQLTCVGSFAPVFIQQEITNNQFVIAGGSAGLKISWQVMGVRNDPWFRDHPYQSIVEKKGSEKGRYYYPEGYGQAVEQAIGSQPAIETQQK